jgi:hypothetical protein
LQEIIRYGTVNHMGLFSKRTKSVGQAQSLSPSDASTPSGAQFLNPALIAEAARTIGVVVVSVLVAVVTTLGEIVSLGIFGGVLVKPWSPWTEQFGLAPFVVVALIATTVRYKRTLSMLILALLLVISVKSAIEATAGINLEWPNMIQAAGSLFLILTSSVVVVTLFGGSRLLNPTKSMAVLVGLTVGGITSSLFERTNGLALVMWGLSLAAALGKSVVLWRSQSRPARFSVVLPSVVGGLIFGSGFSFMAYLLSS